MVVKLSTFLSSSLAEGLDSALVTGIIASTDVALDSGTSGNYVAQITGGDGIIALNASAHEATAEIKVDSASIPTNTNVATLTNKTFNLTNNTLTGTLGQFNAALNGSTFASLDGGETLTNKTLTSPTINTPQIVGPGSFSKVTTLGLRDQSTNAFDLRVFSNSSTALTDNRTLTFDTENVNRSVKLGGDLIIDKELRTAGNFNLLMNLADSTNITLPTSGTVMQFDSNGASTITGAFTAGTLTGHYLGADSDVTELVTKTFVDTLNVDAETLGGRDSDYFLNYNNFTNTPSGSVALASLGVNPPSTPSNGQIWWDDSAGNLYIYYVDSEGDTQWVEAVPQLAAQDFYSTAGGAIAGNVSITANNTTNAIAISKNANNFMSLERSNKSSGTGFFGVNVETNSQATMAYDATGNMVIGSSTGPSTQAGFSQTMKFNGGSGFVGIGPVSDAEAPLEVYWPYGNVTGGTLQNQLTLTAPTNAYGNGPKMTWAVDWGGYIKTAEIGAPNVSGGNGYGGELRFSVAKQTINSMTERMCIDALGKVKTYGNEFYINYGGGNVNSSNTFQALTTEVDCNTSGTWVDVCYVTHSPCLRYHGMSIENGNGTLGGARYMGVVYGTYGSVVTVQEQKRISAMNGGTVSDIDYRYMNSGASSGSYRLQVKLTHSGSAFKVQTVVFGNAIEAIYADGS